MLTQSINRNDNPIVIIDDDEEDISLMMEAILSLNINNEVVTFDDADAALEYLAVHDNPPPFIILCDIHMPKIDGYKFRKRVEADDFLRLRATPFVFLATTNEMEYVNKAYTHSIQGYFTKPKSYRGFVELFERIISYWRVSVLPNPFIGLKSDGMTSNS